MNSFIWADVLFNVQAIKRLTGNCVSKLHHIGRITCMCICSTIYKQAQKSYDKMVKIPMYQKFDIGEEAGPTIEILKSKNRFSTVSCGVDCIYIRINNILTHSSGRIQWPDAQNTNVKLISCVTGKKNKRTRNISGKWSWPSACDVYVQIMSETVQLHCCYLCRLTCMRVARETVYRQRKKCGCMPLGVFHHSIPTDEHGRFYIYIYTQKNGKIGNTDSNWIQIW